MDDRAMDVDAAPHLRALDTHERAFFSAQCDALARALEILPDKPEETAEASLSVLWKLATGQAVSVQRALTEPLHPLQADARTRLGELIARRLSGIPLAHMTQRQCFMGLELLAGPQALIPRRETELLGAAALRVLHDIVADRQTARVVDVCTGSGNLAVALGHFTPAASVFAADLSGDAVELARRNVAHLGLEERVEVRQGDLLAPFDEASFVGKVDLLVCNPPYISTGKMETMPGEIIGFEPRMAFDGGPLGIRILQRLIREAPRFLRAGGWLAFEVGAGQGPAVLKRLANEPAFVQFEQVVDDSGQIRAIVTRVAS